jgi:glutamate-ammonia-ligase adenylyltransferase
MDAAFSAVTFAEPERAKANLEQVAPRLPESLWSKLPALLAQLPDPDTALNYLERYLAVVDPNDSAANARNVRYLEQHPVALHHLLVLFSYSRYLSEFVLQQPSLVAWLHGPARHGPATSTSLEELKSPEDLFEEFAQFEAMSGDDDPTRVLIRFKRRQYLRITLRDVLGLATLAETTLELSHLADVLLERALRIAAYRLEHDHGVPEFVDAEGRKHPTRMAILSLGKLGGQELNYSSDIDLLFLYGQPGQTSGGAQGSTPNAEYFTRLAQEVLHLLTEPMAEGAVYRVDLRLRPQGREGDLASSLPAAVEYYRVRAREWELQMLIKARGSAGDPALSRSFLEEVQPLVYRREFHLAVVEAVLNAREEMTRGLKKRAKAGSHTAVWNVKLSPGGIRDIEFLAQCLQRLYGGADPWLRSPSTLFALGRLHDKGHISGRDFFRLSAAYQFLRRVEHRLQLRDGLQRHTLPEAADALESVARRCGVEAGPADERTPGTLLLKRLTEYFSDVREIYERILSGSGPEPGAGEDAATSDPGTGAILRRLRQEYPTVAAMATMASDERPEDEALLVRRGLTRFLDSAILQPKVMAQLEARPEWVLIAAEVLERSDLAVDLLSSNPEEISAVADPGLAGFRGALPQIAPGEPLTQQAVEDAMTALRVAYRRGVLATLVRALLGSSQPFDTFHGLSQLAEQALERALELAAAMNRIHERIASDFSIAPFSVLALGRLGTGEMDIGSDVDLIFLVDENLSQSDREIWRLVAERLVHIASSHTREGLLFPIDTRLRPRGGDGETLQTSSYLREYFNGEAQAWEAATFLKARPIAGNLALGAEALRQVHECIARRFSDPKPLARDLAKMRQRLEREGADPDRPIGQKGEFKRMAGGYYDVEYVVAFLFLTRVLHNEHPTEQSLIEGRGHVLRQIALLEATGHLGSTEAQTLRAGAMLYRSIDHALRIVTGRSANHLPETTMAQRVVRLLEQWQFPLPEGIEAAVETTRRHVRGIYEHTVVRAAESKS